MIRAILKKGKIKPLDKLPKHWQDGQELLIDASEPSNRESDIKKWYARLRKLSAQIPRKDHERMRTALAEQDRQAKASMAREMGLR